MKNQKSQNNRLLTERARELRRQMTPAETLLWNRLRKRQLAGLKFRRQAPIGPFIADFYCAEFKLVVEVDGGIHAARRDADEQRTQILIEHGYRVLRVKNEEALADLDEVLGRILAASQDSPHSASPEVGKGDDG